MKTNLLKSIAACLLVSAVPLGLLSCSSGGSAQGSETTAATPETTSAADTETEAETEPEYYAGLSGLDYEGYNFNILTYKADNWSLYLNTDSETGEVLNDSAYRRRLETEELLDITITQQEDSSYTSTFKKYVLAGDGSSVDLIAFWAVENLSPFITGNLVFDWSDVPYLELDAEWYNQNADSTFKIADKQYFAVSDITFTVHQHFRILFNKQLMDDLGLEYPYQSVYDGTWTYPELMSYTKDVYSDLDGDGAAGDQDRYGMGLNAAFGSMFVNNAGEIPVTAESDGFKINLNSERIVSIVTDLVALRSNSDVYFAKGSNAHYDVFNAGRSMFSFYGSDPALLREIDEFDFGYLPYPKYDDSQDEYYVFSSGGLMAIPVSAEDIERTGAVIEAFSQASNRYVKDAFVEKYVQNKVLRDEDSQRIYLLMREWATYDFAYNIDPSGKLTNYAWYSYFLNNATADVSSYYAKNESKITEAFQTLYDEAVAAQ